MKTKVRHVRNHAKWMRNIHELLDGHSLHMTSSLWYHRIMVLVILINIAVIIGEVAHDLSPSTVDILRLVDMICVIIFSIEYVLRLWASPSATKYQYLHALKARLSTAFTPLMIVDLISILPFYLMLFIDFQQFGLDIALIRVIRLLRVLRLTRESTSVQAMLGVLDREKQSLFASFVLINIVAILAAALMVTFEAKLQPDKFGNIISALWFVTATMTTVGYGDVTPLTLEGRIVASVLMFAGLGLFALWTGLIASGFVEELNRRSFSLNRGILLRQPAFSRFTPHEIDQLLRFVMPIQIEPRHLLIRVGESGDHMYFIIAGSVEILLEQPVILSEGDFFGDAAFLYRQRRNANVVSLEKCRLLRLSRADFLWMMDSMASFRAHVESVTGRRHRPEQNNLIRPAAMVNPNDFDHGGGI